MPAITRSAKYQTKKKDELHAIEKAVQKRWTDEHMFEVDAPKVGEFTRMLMA